MNKTPDVQKSLAQISANEKGWRKVLATAEGSYSRSFATEQLRRLEAQRNSLISQQENTDAVSR
jgi:hypothetical protein